MRRFAAVFHLFRSFSAVTAVFSIFVQKRTLASTSSSKFSVFFLPKFLSRCLQTQVLKVQWLLIQVSSFSVLNCKFTKENSNQVQNLNASSQSFLLRQFDLWSRVAKQAKILNSQLPSPNSPLNNIHFRFYCNSKFF